MRIIEAIHIILQFLVCRELCPSRVASLFGGERVGFVLMPRMPDLSASSSSSWPVAAAAAEVLPCISRSISREAVVRIQGPGVAAPVFVSLRAMAVVGSSSREERASVLSPAPFHTPRLQRCSFVWASWTRSGRSTAGP
jgi:hypothetical protein